MNEGEWLNATHPLGMLLVLRDKVSDRKVLLFNLACCRRIWPHLGSKDRKTTVLAEQFAESTALIEKLQRRLNPERAATFAVSGSMSEDVNPDLVKLLRTQTHIRMELLGKDVCIGILAHQAAQLLAQNAPERALPINPEPALRYGMVSATNG